jgi:Zn-dependent protease
LLPWRLRKILRNLENAILINIVLAVFNLFPLPPLDGGRIAVGLLPRALATPLSRLEPYGFPILIGLLFIIPLLGAQLGLDFSFISQILGTSSRFIIENLLRFTGNAP